MTDEVAQDLLARAWASDKALHALLENIEDPEERKLLAPWVETVTAHNLRHRFLCMQSRCLAYLAPIAPHDAFCMVQDRVLRNARGEDKEVLAMDFESWSSFQFWGQFA